MLLVHVRLDDAFTPCFSRNRFREAFTIGWEQWAAVSVSLAILRALNLNQADSVLVMGDGDLLLDVFLSVVASR